MPLKLTLLYLSLFLICITADGQHQLRIETTQTGDAIVASAFAGSLLFPGIDTLGVAYNRNEGHFLARVDSKGKIKWVQHLASPNASFGRFGLTTDRADNIYLAGNFYDSLRLGKSGISLHTDWPSTFVAKFDSSGHAIWAIKSIAPPIPRPFIGGVDITLDHTGNLYLSGSYSNGIFGFAGLPLLPDSSAGGSNSYIAKFDTSGNPIWIRTLHGDNSPIAHFITSITADSLGVYMCGEIGGVYDGGKLTFGQLEVQGDSNLSEIFLAKCDAFGKPLWLKKTNGIVGDDSPIQITSGDSASLYMVGDFMGQIQLGQQPPLSVRGHDAVVCRFDTFGRVNWAIQAAYNPDFRGRVDGKGITNDPLGNIFVTGINYFDTIQFHPLAPVPYEVSTIGGRSFLVKLGSSGLASCIQTHPSLVGAVAADRFGNVWTFGGDLGPYSTSRVVISKWSNNCEHLWDFDITRDIALSMDTQLSGGLRLFPNPTTNILYLDSKVDLGSGTLFVYDLKGKLLLEQGFEQSTAPQQIDLSSFSPST